MSDCMQLIQDLMEFSDPSRGYGSNRPSDKPPILNTVYVTLSIHQANHVVSYGPRGRVARVNDPTRPDWLLAGSVVQYFSDRIVPGTDQQWFDMNLGDDIALNIHQNPLRIELLLQSWDNVSMIYEPVQCGPNIIFAYSEPLGHLIALTFEKELNPKYA